MHTSMTAFVDALQARGRYTLTLSEAAKANEHSTVAVGRLCGD